MCLLSLSSHHLNKKRQGFAAVCKCQVRRYLVLLSNHTRKLPRPHPSISTCKHIKQARVIPSMRHNFIIIIKIFILLFRFTYILMVLSIALQLVLPCLEEIYGGFLWYSIALTWLSFPRMWGIAWAGWIWRMGQRPTSWSWTHAPAKHGLWSWLE